MQTKPERPTTLNLSESMIRSIIIALEMVIKVSGTDIRLHGLENVPDSPVLYVVNHFTRMETILLPYVIRKHVGKYPVSLADDSFFSGRLGQIMSRGGAISTADPDRDKILIRMLLTDEHPVVIFPEGRMIKDKKIVEKGKYLINSTTGRRPPHTGAGRIALRSEFLRQELRLLQSRGDTDAINTIASHFGFDPAVVNRILEKETFIVPVNITYYPVRAKDNAVSRLVNRFVSDLSARMREEMQVEGSMVADGVDIDINLGAPIAAKNYLTAKTGIDEMISDAGLYLDPAELKHAAPFKKIYIKMMYDYMRAIYGMTTVNGDHLASYLLSRYRKNIIVESDFKNRLYLAVKHLKQTQAGNCHRTLLHDQLHYLSDDRHEKYENFIADLVADGLIERSGGRIRKNPARFSKAYEFQTIRQDNIVEVLKNEIEPLEDLTAGLNRMMLYPATLLRRRIRKQFLQEDRDQFREDYARYSIKGESKPASIGEPFFCKRFWASRGVILVHGYMAAPEEIRPLADFLYKSGYCVYGVRLRGHGTSPEDLAARAWPEWYESVNRAYIVMKNTVKAFTIAGFSTGAGLALLQAAEKPGRFAGAISINGPARLQNRKARYAPLIVGWNKLLTSFRVRKGKMEFVVNDPENPHINYTRNPVSGVLELERLMKHVKSRLPQITGPVLVIQGSDDPVVSPISGEDIYARLGSASKELVQISADRHGILRGIVAEEVNQSILAFLKKVMK